MFTHLAGWTEVSYRNDFKARSGPYHLVCAALLPNSQTHGVSWALHAGQFSMQGWAGAMLGPRAQSLCGGIGGGGTGPAGSNFIVGEGNAGAQSWCVGEGGGSARPLKAQSWHIEQGGNGAWSQGLILAHGDNPAHGLALGHSSG